MSKDDSQIVIKKYANRRLYNTDTSTYVTLDDLATMVKRGDYFVVVDAKSGDDITHSVLTQIIFEQENKTGNTMLPVSFLRQIITYYGDQMQMVVPSFLEQSMASFSQQHDKMREQMTSAFGDAPVNKNLQMVEEQVRQNTEIFQQAMKMFMPFGQADKSTPEPTQAPKDTSPSNSDLNEVKDQLRDLQEKLNALTK